MSGVAVAAVATRRPFYLNLVCPSKENERNWIIQDPHEIVSAVTMSRCVHEGAQNMRGLSGWLIQTQWPRAGEVLRVQFYNPLL